jgi:hypothetical protein
MKIKDSLCAVPHISEGRAIAQAVSRWLPGFEPGSGHMGFVVDKAELGQVFFRVLRFSLPSMPPIAPHSSSSIIIGGWYNRPVVASVIVSWFHSPPPPAPKESRNNPFGVTAANSLK